MNISVSHPTGNRNVRALLQGLIKNMMLVEFGTTIAANSSNVISGLLPSSIRREWLRRSFSVEPQHIHSHPWLEFARFILPRIGLEKYTRHEKGWASLDAVYHNLDNITAARLKRTGKSKNVTAVYAYEDGALETFKQAKKLGLKCIYDLPIAYWQTGKKLMEEEAARLPEWAVTLGGGILDSEAKLKRKTQELELADIVVVPGDFVKDSLPEWAKHKIIIVSPFGSPANSETKSIDNTDTKRPLRILFAGSMGQRKGLGDLFAAMNLLKGFDIELVVMGSLLAPESFYRSQFADFTYEPGRSHDEVLALMRTCDVFCLPSIVEGRALVMQEAMSQGLPLIITPNTGGEDLIKESQTGFIVPIRSPKAIAEKILWFLNNRSEIPRMGQMAQEHAAGYTWESYSEKIIIGCLKDHYPNQ